MKNTGKNNIAIPSRMPQRWPSQSYLWMEDDSFCFFKCPHTDCDFSGVINIVQIVVDMSDLSFTYPAPPPTPINAESYYIAFGFR